MLPSAKPGLGPRSHLSGLVAVARGPDTDVGSRHRVRLLRRHCVYETSVSCASLLGSTDANDTDGAGVTRARRPGRLRPTSAPGPAPFLKQSQTPETA